MEEHAYVIPQETLDRVWQRAARYDGENAFFAEDFQELKKAGYLRLAIPSELGGLGRTLADG